ncbi:MAG: DNA primase small subunit domain-containing protein, partial [Acidimicrobiia bacterium]
AAHLDRPDRMIFDLDPPVGEVPAARRAARTVRAVLEDLGLPAAVMTTGSKGYHVVVPLRPEADRGRVAEAAEAIARLTAARHPTRLTTEFRIAKRQGRVFLDWLRNRYAQSTVAPWSLRPRAGAPVAMPIAWEELGRAAPDRWKLPDVERRLEEGDPWAGLEDRAVPVQGALSALEEAQA